MSIEFAVGELAQFDLVLRGGLIVDGTGQSPFIGDVAVKGDRIAAVGAAIVGPGAEEVDVSGCWITPGFVDIHTHFDAQVSWDSDLRPSTDHGVTTVVMGNCGVGFAPVRRDDREYLIDLMEGVEDIPGAALHEGIIWAWETFPEFIQALSEREFAADVVTQIPYSAARVFVMGAERAIHEEPSADEREAISNLIFEGLQAGAAGVSLSRVSGHQSLDGTAVPGTAAELGELRAVAEGLRRAGHGVLQLVPSGYLGEARMGLKGDRWSIEEELGHLRVLMDVAGCPVTFSMSERSRDASTLRRARAAAQTLIDDGYAVFPQFMCRAGGVLSSFASHHPFERRPTFREIVQREGRGAGLLREVAVRHSIVAEKDLPARSNTLMDNFERFVSSNLEFAYMMGDYHDPEPDPETSVVAIASREGRHAYDVMFQHMAEGGVVAVLVSNYASGNLDPVADLINDPACVVGLGDSGAHVRFICDGSSPTTMLTHWVLNRSRGPKVPVELAVKRLTSDNSQLYGLLDRGVVRAGYRADLNVIDPARLSLRAPRIVHDLPAKGARFVQDATGFVLTTVGGVPVRRDDARTGRLPGRLIRIGG